MQAGCRRRVLVYADPPYVLGTRHGKQYQYEIEDAGHEELLDVLLEHKGPILLSGYDNDLYNDRLCGWHVASKRDGKLFSDSIQKNRSFMDEYLNRKNR